MGTGPDPGAMVNSNGHFLSWNVVFSGYPKHSDVGVNCQALCPFWVIGVIK